MYIRPLTEFDPPSTLPRGAGTRRLSAWGSGSDSKAPRQAWIAEGVAPGQRHADAEVLALVVTGLQQQHVDRSVLGQARGEHAAGRAAADDDVVDALQRYSTV
jgi:hypothetical protein